MSNKQLKQNIIKPTILIVHNYYQIPGGEDSVVENEKKMMEEKGHKVILYSRNNLEINNMSMIKKVAFPIITFFNPVTYIDIRKIIKKEKVDIVHVHNTLNLISPAVYYSALVCKVPIVQTIHNFRMICPGALLYRDGKVCEECIEYGVKRAIKYKCYRNSRLQTIACIINSKISSLNKIYQKIKYICLTDFNKQKLMIVKDISSEQVFVKPNFIENKEEIIAYKDRKNQFVYAGRLDKTKGIEVLLKSWNKMGKGAPKLIICGTGPMIEWCKQFISQNDLETIELKGYVSNEETKRIIAKSKALILPTQLYEGFPMTIVEAYSVGTPVITSDIGNTKNLIENGKTGYLFNPKSEMDLNRAVNLINKNDSMQDYILRIYNEKYTKEINYKILLSIYKGELFKEGV